jgi:hypothetical protein
VDKGYTHVEYPAMCILLFCFPHKLIRESFQRFNESLCDTQHSHGGPTNHKKVLPASHKEKDEK